MNIPYRALAYRFVRRTGPASYFDRLYTMSRDPFRLETSPYDVRKRERLMEVVTRRPTVMALDAGCGTGIIARMLAEHCDHVIAIDFSAQAVSRARAHNDRPERLDIRHADLTDLSLAERFDLVVCSEVLYYLEGAMLEAAVQGIRSVCQPDARFVAVLPARKEAAVMERISEHFRITEQVRFRDRWRPYSITLCEPISAMPSQS